MQLRSILLSLSILLVTYGGGNIMAGVPVVHSSEIEAEALYLGPFSSLPSDDSIAESKTAFLLLGKPKVLDNNSFAPAACGLGLGEVVYFQTKLPPIQPGTIGIIRFTCISPHMDAWHHYQWLGISKIKPLKQKSVEFLFKQNHPHFLYGLSRLSIQKIDLFGNDTDRHIHEAYHHQHLSLPDYAWILSNTNRTDMLAVLAEENNLAKVYYLFNLMDNNRNQEALDFLHQHAAVVSILLPAFHNATMMRPVLQTDPVALLDVPTGILNQGPAINLTALLELSLCLRMGLNEKAEVLTNSLRPLAEDITSCMETVHPLKPWVHVYEPFFGIPRPMDYFAVGILDGSIFEK